jgi:hypothetical protein
MRRRRTNNEFAEMVDRLLEKAMSFLQVIIFANIVVLIVAQILKLL